MARKNYYAADFECTTSDPSYAYSFGIVKVGEANPQDVKVIYNPTDIKQTINKVLDYIFSLPNKCTIFFHNLNYDASFILSHLLRDKLGEVKECVIGDMNHNYFKIVITNGNKDITLRDSYCLFNAKLSSVLKAYTKFKKLNTPLFKTVDDIEFSQELDEYQRIDVCGLATALHHRLEVGCNALTTAGGAMREFKKIIKSKVGYNFNLLFPLLEEDLHNDLKRAYRGGFTFLNPTYKNIIHHNVRVLDVNSMYPAQMKNKILPTGMPQIVESGSVKVSVGYPLGLQRIRVKSFECKDDYVPFLCLRSSTLVATQYLDAIDEGYTAEERTFLLTLQEYELFLKSYKYEGLELLGGYLFTGKVGLFNEYIEKFWKMKLSDDPVIKSLGKLFLNALYGKFGEGYRKQDFHIFYGEKVSLELESETNEPVGYIPVAIFITSYSRVFLILSILAVGYQNFIYCDTDSIHITVMEPKNLHIHPNELGAWKLEKVFKRAKYIRAKRYMGESEIDGKRKLYIVCAGIKMEGLQRCIKKIEDFNEGVGIPSIEFKMGSNGMYSRDKVVRI